MAMVEKIKNKLRGNGFLLAVTIVLFFVLYIAGAILYKPTGVFKLVH